MSNTRSTWRNFRRYILGGLAAPAFLSLTAQLPAAEEPAKSLPATPKAEAATPISVVPSLVPLTAPMVLDLASARHLALEKQPALAAYRASLAAAQAKVEALDNLPTLASLLNPDVKVRRCQAGLGVQIAEAQLNQAAWDALDAVTRLYWTAVYADEQLRAISDTINKARDRIKPKTDDKFHWTHEQLAVHVEYLQARRAAALDGRKRALAALREAIGLCGDVCVEVPDRSLPPVHLDLCCHQVVTAALDRRGEVCMANLAAEVADLEIDAQAAVHGYSSRTYAAGGDIHSRAVPQGHRGGDYHPDAVGPEMPTLLAGSCKDRVEQARAYAGRAHAVADKTHNLIVLEAENAFLKWEEAVAQWHHLRKARDLAKDNADARLKEAEDDKVTRAEALRANELYTQMRVEANEALYNLLLAVTNLERVTAGGVCSPLVPPIPGHP